MNEDYRIVMRGMKSFISPKSSLGIWHYQMLANNNKPIMSSGTFYQKRKCRSASRKVAEQLDLPWEELRRRK